jgi:oligoribonuclease (3'-5' exoribonuclease)
MNDTQPLEKNKHVKELAELLNNNGLNTAAQGFAEIIGHVSAMERDLSKAIGELTAMRRELSSMREEQGNPVKNMMHKAADGLMVRLKDIQKQIATLKNKIIGICKQAVDEIKTHGILAANSVADFINIRGDMESAKESINDSIAYNNKQIAKIESVSTEMHSASRHIKNIGRAFMGKEPIPDIKPNGRLARLVQAPFRFQIQRLNNSSKRTDKILHVINKLEKAAELRAERSRPSVHDDMKRIKGEISQTMFEAPNPVKIKTSVQEL